MTDNEKAATFIGWKPGRRCDGLVHHMRDFSTVPANRCVCESCGVTAETPTYIAHSHDHDIPAPDMTDPRNYMMALEGLSHLWRIANHPRQVDIKIWDIGQPAERLEINIVAQRDSVNKSIVEALAALYDAEHPAQSNAGV